MLVHCNQNTASAPPRLHAIPLARTRVQYAEPAQFANHAEWLRARKAALRSGLRYRSAGGEKLCVIATAMGVSDAKASRMLNPDDRTDDVTETHLMRLDFAGFAHVAEAVRGVKLGIGAPVARAA